MVGPVEAVLEPGLLDLYAECDVGLSERCREWVDGRARHTSGSVAREAERCLGAAEDAWAGALDDQLEALGARERIAHRLALAMPCSAPNALQCAGRLLSPYYDAPRARRVLPEQATRSVPRARSRPCALLSNPSGRQLQKTSELLRGEGDMKRIMMALALAAYGTGAAAQVNWEWTRDMTVNLACQEGQVSSPTAGVPITLTASYAIPDNNLKREEWIYRNTDYIEPGMWGELAVGWAGKWNMRMWPKQGATESWVQIPRGVFEGGNGFVNHASNKLDLLTCKNYVEPFTGIFTHWPEDLEYRLGETFTFKFTFMSMPSGLSYRTIRDAFFDVHNGHILRVRRDGAGNQRWLVTVRPAGGTVTIKPRDTASCSRPAAVCTAHGARFIRNNQVLTVEQYTPPLPTVHDLPPILTVTPPTATEGADSSLDFVYSLSRASDNDIVLQHVAYSSTAKSGKDFQGGRGTTTITAGETEATVSIPLIDDSVKESTEQMYFWVHQYSGITRENIRPEAAPWNTLVLLKGTILDNDSATVARETLARFGNVVADGVMKAAEARFRAPRGEPFAAMFQGGGEPRELSRHEVLSGTSFAVSSGPTAAWGRGMVSHFDGGSAETVISGFDVESGRSMFGLMASHTRSHGGHSLDATMTTMLPYARHSLTERTSVWGMAGLGAGEVESVSTDFMMSAFGARSSLVEDGAWSLSANFDTRFVTTMADDVSASTMRSRANLEAEATAWFGRNSVSPRLTLGMSHEDGDADTGSGIDVDAALRFFMPAARLSGELRTKDVSLSLTRHLSRENEVGLSVRHDPHGSAQVDAQWRLRF